MLDEAKMRRLAMTQYMYTMAVDQSHQPEPLNMLSIQLFHDAVEHFLALASEHLDAGKTGQAFMAYWEPISQKLPNKDFGHKDSMNRLNAARTNWKHHGISLPTTEIDDFRTNVADFFRENTPKVFGVNFEEISMTALVQDEEVRNRLLQAEHLSSTGEIKAALVEIAIAFLVLLGGLEWKALEQNSIHLKAVSSHRLFSRVENEAPRELARFARAIDRELDALHKQVMLLSLGIDYRRYMRFQGLAPSVYQTTDGVYRLAGEGRGQSYQDYLFCSQFVIECALHVQELQLF
ncbi:MAG TPA: hypothetical protein VF026_30285 [Ktedonobacteraceae bacterium]